MEAIQRRAAWFVAQDFSRYSSVQSYLNDLEWTPLKDHQRNIRLTFIFRVVTGRVAVQSEGTLSPADNRTRHKHNTSINTYQQPVTSAWTLSLSKLSPIGTPYQRRASQRILLPHSSHACANPHSAALRYPPHRRDTLSRTADSWPRTRTRPRTTNVHEDSFLEKDARQVGPFLSLAHSKPRLCSANHRPGYWSNLPCDWPSTAWAYSE